MELGVLLPGAVPGIPAAYAEVREAGCDPGIERPPADHGCRGTDCEAAGDPLHLRGEGPVARGHFPGGDGRGRQFPGEGAHPGGALDIPECGRHGFYQGRRYGLFEGKGMAHRTGRGHRPQEMLLYQQRD